jgi:hypothetical protein
MRRVRRKVYGKSMGATGKVFEAVRVGQMAIDCPVLGALSRFVDGT